jgi:hypothetical protein
VHCKLLKKQKQAVTLLTNLNLAKKAKAPGNHSGLFFSGQPVNLIELALLRIDHGLAVILELHSQCRVDGPLGMVLVLFAAVIHSHDPAPLLKRVHSPVNHLVLLPYVCFLDLPAC